MAYITAEMLEDYACKYPSGEPYYLPEEGITGFDPSKTYYRKEAGGYVPVDQSTEEFDPSATYYTAHTAVERYVEAAAEMVNRHLGYDPERREYEETVRGNGSEGLTLSAPVLELHGVSRDGGEEELSGYETVKNHVVRYEGYAHTVFPEGVPYTVRYTGGFERVPQDIVQTALQLGALLWESAGGNIAVSSTAFADTGSRVFNNFKADRFLEQINGYRIYGGKRDRH